MFNLIEKFTDQVDESTSAPTVQETTPASADDSTSTAAPVSGTTATTGSTTTGSTTSGSTTSGSTTSGTTTATEEPSNIDVSVIVGATVGAIVVILIVVAILVARRRRNSN